MSRHALGGKLDRKLPSCPDTTCHEVVPVRPLTLMVTVSAGRKLAPHTVAPIVIGGAAAIIGRMHRKIRA
jgi:hypothetical protein